MLDSGDSTRALILGLSFLSLPFSQNSQVDLRMQHNKEKTILSPEDIFPLFIWQFLILALCTESSIEGNIYWAEIAAFYFNITNSSNLQSSRKLASKIRNASRPKWNMASLSRALSESWWLSRPMQNRPSKLLCSPQRDLSRSPPLVPHNETKLSIVSQKRRSWWKVSSYSNFLIPI